MWAGNCVLMWYCRMVIVGVSDQKELRPGSNTRFDESPWYMYEIQTDLISKNT